MRDFRVAIIGQGRSGRDIHGAYFKSDLNKRVKVVAVAELDPERRERAQSEYEGCDVYADYRDFLKRDDIDLVVNATFSQDHYSITKELLKAGKNVLVEKPMARTRYECDDLILTAEQNGVTLGVFQQSFFAPFFTFVKSVVDSGKLGQLKQVNLTYSGFSRRWDWQTLQCKMAGSIYNTGPHPIGLALHFLDFDDNARVAYSRLGRTSLVSGDAEDYAKIILEAPGKPVVDIEMISTDAYPEDTIKLFGTQGCMKCKVSGEYEMKYVIPGENPERPVIFESLKNDSGLPAYCSENLITHEESGKIEGTVFDVAVDEIYEMLYEKIKHGKQMSVTPEMAARIIGVIEAVHAENPIPVRYN